MMTFSRLALLLPILLSACAPSTHEARVMDVTPSWYATAKPLDRDKPVTHLVGRGASSSASQQVALDMARMSAMTDLGRALDAQFSGLIKQAQEQTGAGQDPETLQHFTSAAKVVMADVDLGGTIVGQQYLTAVDGTYYCWLTLELPLAEANRKFLDDLRRNNATYERFRATQLYDEMNREIEKYRAFEQGQRPPR